LAACCYISGLNEEGDRLLEDFGWGKAFYEINSELFKIYSLCNGPNEVALKQDEYINRLEKEYSDRKHYDDDLLSRNPNHLSAEDSEEEILDEFGNTINEDMDEFDNSIQYKLDRFGNTIVEDPVEDKTESRLVNIENNILVNEFNNTNIGHENSPVE
jgi:hypothetical protein